MKNVQQITLGSIVFSIESDAYTELQQYLDSVAAYFTTTMQGGASEVVQDIETGIAEKMIARKKSLTKAITRKDVQEVVVEVGSVEALRESEDATEGENTHTDETVRNTHQRRRLYRDVDEAVIGGVSAGLAKYFDIDVVIVRVAFLLTLIFSGFGFWMYIILWMAVPRAETKAQKMAMHGESVNLTSVKAYVRERLDEVPSDTSKKVKGFFNKYLFKRGGCKGECGDGFARFLIAVRRLSGVGIIIVTSIIMVTLSVLLMAALQAGFGVEMDAVTAGFFASIVTGGLVWAAIAVYVVLIIPVWFVFMFGKWLVALKTRIHIVLVMGLGFIWMLAFSYALVTVSVQASKVVSYISHVQETQLSDDEAQFYLRIKDEDNGEQVFTVDIDDNGLLIEAGNEVIYNGVQMPPTEGMPFGTDPRLIGGDAEPGTPLDNVILNGAGTEPFWSFEYRNGQLVWTMPAADAVGNMVETVYDVGFARDGTSYKLWGLGESNIRVSVIEGICSDGMSDRVYTHKVRAKLESGTYRGCANNAQN